MKPKYRILTRTGPGKAFTFYVPAPEYGAFIMDNPHNAWVLTDRKMARHLAALLSATGNHYEVEEI